MFGITAAGVATTGYLMSLGSVGLFVLVGPCAAPCHYRLQIAGADYSHRGALIAFVAFLLSVGSALVFGQISAA